MGKLIGQIFKEDFKSIILWLFIPLASSLVLMQLLSAFEGATLLSLAMGFSMTLLMIGPFLSLAIAAKNDNERFYGDNAGFYSVLPISTRAMTRARIINFILLGLVIAFSALVNFLVLNLSFAPGLRISDFFTGIANLISQVDLGKFTLILLNLFIFGVYIVSIIMFANTAGSTRIFGKKSKYAPVIIFLIIFFGLGMLGARIQSSFMTAYIYQSFGTSSRQAELSYPAVTRMMLIPLIINILISLGFVGLSSYIHDKKLSVY